VSNGDGDENAEKHQHTTNKYRRDNNQPSRKHRREERYAALDLGTNNCRLLIAAPRGKSYRIVDAFSRIIRLGEGVSQSGRLSEVAMERTIGALRE